MSIADLIKHACDEWSEPQVVESHDLRLRCSMDPSIGVVTIDPETPPDLAELWKRVHTARPTSLEHFVRSFIAAKGAKFWVKEAG